MTGQFAKSLAGHDKGKIYVVTGETGPSVLLSDGDRRPLAKAKSKNRKHVQIFGEVNRIDTDEEIRRTIRDYLRRITDV